jgi:hypothetical protein
MHTWMECAIYSRQASTSSIQMIDRKLRWHMNCEFKNHERPTEGELKGGGSDLRSCISCYLYLSIPRTRRRVLPRSLM